MRVFAHRAVILVMLLAGCDDPASGPTPSPPEPAPDPPAASFVEVDAESLPDLLRGRPEPLLLVNVWSTWCRPCLDEMPALVSTARHYEGQGLGGFFISVDAPDQREAALGVVRQQGIPLPAYIKTGPDGAFIEALHDPWSGALPATLLLDRDRRVVRFWEEEVDRDMLSGPIRQLLASSAESHRP